MYICVSTISCPWQEGKLGILARVLLVWAVSYCDWQNGSRDVSVLKELAWHFGEGHAKAGELSVSTCKSWLRWESSVVPKKFSALELIVFSSDWGLELTEGNGRLCVFSLFLLLHFKCLYTHIIQNKCSASHSAVVSQQFYAWDGFILSVARRCCLLFVSFHCL